jgi:hypothetical protein
MINKPDYTPDSISLSSDVKTIKSVIANFIIEYNQVNWDVDLNSFANQITADDLAPEDDENQLDAN